MTIPTYPRKPLWQAKHDKSGLIWKSPIESQWSMCEIEKSPCEIEKSLCEIEKSLREITKSLYEKLKLLYENEKMSCEIIITNREWKTAMWDLYYLSTMKNRCVRKRNHHSRLSIGFFLSRWDISSQRRVFWRDFLLSRGQYKTWTADYGLRTTDYGLRTGYKTRTKHYGLGIKSCTVIQKAH